jgi:hypothetical protein
MDRPFWEYEDTASGFLAQNDWMPLREYEETVQSAAQPCLVKNENYSE